MSSGRRAALLYVITLGYFAAINHLPLQPWNPLDRPSPELTSTAVGLVPGLLVVAVLLRGGPRLTAAASLWPATWLLLQVLQWWVPYLLDVHPLTADAGRWYRDGGYDETLHLIRPQDGRVVPDAEHMVLQTLTLAVTCGAMITARAKARRAA